MCGALAAFSLKGALVDGRFPRELDGLDEEKLVVLCMEASEYLHTT